MDISKLDYTEICVVVAINGRRITTTIPKVALTSTLTEFLNGADFGGNTFYYAVSIGISVDKVGVIASKYDGIENFNGASIYYR